MAADTPLGEALWGVYTWLPLSKEENILDSHWSGPMSSGS